MNTGHASSGSGGSSGGGACIKKYMEDEKKHSKEKIVDWSSFNLEGVDVSTPKGRDEAFQTMEDTNTLGKKAEEPYEHFWVRPHPDDYKKLKEENKKRITRGAKPKSMEDILDETWAKQSKALGFSNCQQMSCKHKNPETGEVHMHVLVNRRDITNNKMVEMRLSAFGTNKKTMFDTLNKIDNQVAKKYNLRLKNDGSALTRNGHSKDMELRGGKKSEYTKVEEIIRDGIKDGSIRNGNGFVTDVRKALGEKNFKTEIKNYKYDNPKLIITSPNPKCQKSLTGAKVNPFKDDGITLKKGGLSPSNLIRKDAEFAREYGGRNATKNEEVKEERSIANQQKTQSQPNSPIHRKSQSEFKRLAEEEIALKSANQMPTNRRDRRSDEDDEEWKEELEQQKREEQAHKFSKRQEINTEIDIRTAAKIARDAERVAAKKRAQKAAQSSSNTTTIGGR